MIAGLPNNSETDAFACRSPKAFFCFPRLVPVSRGKTRRSFRVTLSNRFGVPLDDGELLQYFSTGKENRA